VIGEVEWQYHLSTGYYSAMMYIQDTTRLLLVVDSVGLLTSIFTATVDIDGLMDPCEVDVDDLFDMTNVLRNGVIMFPCFQNNDL